MHDQPEWAYHLARYAQCQRMGLLASDEAIRDLHQQLAASHAERARSAFRFDAAEDVVTAVASKSASPAGDHSSRQAAIAAS